MNQSKTSKLSFIKLAFFFPLVLALALSNHTHALVINSSRPALDLQSISVSQSTEDSVYSMVEKMPEFPGGEKAVINFLSQTIQYPEKAQKKKEQGKVTVQFIISKTGKVENAKVLKGVSPSLDNEALRVISLLPDWIPGEQNGEKVAVYRIIPIVFQNSSSDDESTWEANEKSVIVIDGVKMPSNFKINILSSDKIAAISVLKPFPKKEKSKLMDQYGKQAADGVILITSKKSEIKFTYPDSTVNEPKDSLCKEAAIVPQYPGGELNLMKYIADSIQYPFVAQRLKTQGKVLVQFLVDTTGKVQNARVVKSIDYFLDKEALRVINSLPDWTPGLKCEQKINILVTMPVVFKLDLPAAEKGWEKNDKTIVLLDGERLPSSFDLAWLNYTNLSSYKILQPGSKEINKKLVSEYGKDAVNGVILISTAK